VPLYLSLSLELGANTLKGLFNTQILVNRVQGIFHGNSETYLKMETSQSQDWLGNAMKKQTAPVNHTRTAIAME